MGDDKVKSFSESENIPILMEIPFDRKIAEAYSKGQLIVDVLDGWREKFQELFHQIKKIVK
jgi:MinD superfamily P-loop ATPase